MSGHSKWSTTKHHKHIADVRRGKIFSILSKEITISVRDRGSKPEFNPRLRMLISKAKSINMPSENVNSAILRGTGVLPSVEYYEIIYEGYGAGGVGLLVEVTTDNKPRSSSEVRTTFEKFGGSLTSTVSLDFNFRSMVQFLMVLKNVEQLVEIAINTGAEDIKSKGEIFEILCNIPNYENISTTLDINGIEPISAEKVYLPTIFVPITCKNTAKQVCNLVKSLDSLDEVKCVWSNYDIVDVLN